MSEMGVAPSSAPTLPKRFSLRLDDGTVLKKNGTESMVMKPAEAWRAGYLTEDHLLRAQALLCEVHAKLPDEVEGLKSMSSIVTKRSMDSVLEINQTTSAKRSRSIGGYMANGNGIHSHVTEPLATAPVAAAAPLPPAVSKPPPSVAAAAAPAARPAPAPAALTPDFIRGCDALINYLLNQVLGVNAPIFRDPVDPRFVKDYYSVVLNPICLSQIRGKLHSGQYTAPHDFYNDMTLLFDNCFLYNQPDSTVGQLGARLEAAFDQAWAKLPFASTVPLKGPRVHKIDPARQGTAAIGNTVAKPRGAAASGGAGGVRRGKVGRPPGVVRSKSVNSYQAAAAAQQPLPADKKEELANAMQNEAIMEQKMGGVVDILQNANELPTNEDGEVELDINQLSVPVMWKLYEYVVGGPMPAKPAAGFQVEGEDSDYNPDEEDDE